MTCEPADRQAGRAGTHAARGPFCHRGERQRPAPRSAAPGAGGAGGPGCPGPARLGSPEPPGGALGLLWAGGGRFQSCAENPEAGAGAGGAKLAAVRGPGGAAAGGGESGEYRSFVSFPRP